MKRLAARISNRLSHIPFMKKILLIFLVCILLPLILQNVFFFSTTANDMKDIIHQQAVGSFDQIALLVNASVEDARNLLIRYHSNVRVYEWLDETYESDLDYLMAYQDYVAPLVSLDLSLQSQVEKAVFYTDNPTVFNGAYVRQSRDGHVFQDGMEKELYVCPISDKQLSAMLHVGYQLQNGSQAVGRLVSMTCQLNLYPGLQNSRKVARVDLNLGALGNILTDAPLFDNLLITDADNRVLVSAKGYMQAEAYSVFDADALPEGSILLSRRLDERLPFMLYGYYDAGMVTDVFYQTLHVALGISLGGLLIALGFLLLMSRDLARRMQGLVAKAQRIALGDFSNQPLLSDVACRDEIGQVERSVDALSGQLSSYIQREYEGRLLQAELEKEATQAKLMALQAQVNPHFLFNALECIRLNTLDCDRAETARMIKHLASMFRYLVQWEGDIVYLKEELAFLREFLNIQKYRFGSEFQYDIHVEDAALECLLPKLILQPLVENACVHGIEATSNEKRIMIRVARDGDMLCLKVQDTGKGIPPERLEALRRSVRMGQAGGSVGLYNVYQRLSLYYQNRFSFTVDSEPEHGTLCTVRIPAAYQKEGRKACTLFCWLMTS